MRYTEEITTVKYLINQLVDVRVACQFWINKDHESQERIKELEEQVQTDEKSIDDKEIILMQSKRINELTTSIEQLERFELDNIELKNAIKLAHERIEEFKSGETILKYQDTLGEQQARIKELEEQLAYSYDSGLEDIHPEDMTPDPTPEERKEYNKDRIQEFIKEHLQEDPRDYPEELQYE